MDRTTVLERDLVVTHREALQILGINPVALSQLEPMANVEIRHRRKGYSIAELRQLQSAIKTMALQFS